MEDPYDLERFVRAQDADDTLARALDELASGRKQSHWMWFVFPQVAGLGRSATSRAFAISSLDEARAYLAHAVLGPRLVAAARVVAAGTGRGAVQVFGPVDAAKLRSSMTLFARADPDEPAFADVLDHCFAGAADPATDALLRAQRRSCG